jgi:hypothetical protein
VGARDHPKAKKDARIRGQCSAVHEDRLWNRCLCPLSRLLPDKYSYAGCKAHSCGNRKISHQMRKSLRCRIRHQWTSLKDAVGFRISLGYQGARTPIARGQCREARKGNADYRPGQRHVTVPKTAQHSSPYHLLTGTCGYHHSATTRSTTVTEPTLGLLKGLLSLQTMLLTRPLM